MADQEPTNPEGGAPAAPPPGGESAEQRKRMMPGMMVAKRLQDIAKACEEEAAGMSQMAEISRKGQRFHAPSEVECKMFSQSAARMGAIADTLAATVVQLVQFSELLTDQANAMVKINERLVEVEKIVIIAKPGEPGEAKA